MKRHFAFGDTVTGSIGYGHAGFASYGRQLSLAPSTSCDPRTPSPSPLNRPRNPRPVRPERRETGRPPRLEQPPRCNISQPCLLRREWEHSNPGPCTCINRLCGTLLCPLQVVQGPRVIARPVSLTWASTSITELVPVAYRCREVNCPECCCRCVNEPRSKTQPWRIGEDRTTQSAPNGGPCVRKMAMGSTLPVRCGRCCPFLAVSHPKAQVLTGRDSRSCRG